MDIRETPPQDIDYIDPFRDHDLAVAYLPPLSMFKAENAGWRETLRIADKTGEVATRAVAENISGGLRNVMKYRAMLGQIDESHPNYYQIAEIWSQQAVSTVAHSRLLRMLLGSDIRPGISVEKADICMDFNADELDKGGLHFRANALEFLGVTWPDRNKVMWGEDNSAYYRITSPANPTKLLPVSYSDQYKTPFNPTDFATIHPFLRTTVWMGEE